jgi:hypothetical protein
MAVSLIGDIKAKQDKPYRANVSPYAKEENLFNIAGVR